jgi:hypothetical protein
MEYYIIFDLGIRKKFIEIVYNLKHSISKTVFSDLVINFFQS